MVFCGYLIHSSSNWNKRNETNLNLSLSGEHGKNSSSVFSTFFRLLFLYENSTKITNCNRLSVVKLKIKYEYIFSHSSYSNPDVDLHSPIPSSSTPFHNIFIALPNVKQNNTYIPLHSIQNSTRKEK